MSSFISTRLLHNILSKLYMELGLGQTEKESTTLSILVLSHGVHCVLLFEENT